MPSKGNRFSSEQHAEALKLIASGMKRAEVAASIGCTTESLRRWMKALRRRDARTGANGVAATVEAKIEAAPVAGAPAMSSAPHDPGSGLGEHETATILDYKRKHPSMGPAQIRAQLKRFLGWRVSVRAIARVLHKAGFAKVHRKGRPVGDEHPGRFEAPHRNALWQLDMSSSAYRALCGAPDYAQSRRIAPIVIPAFDERTGSSLLTFSALPGSDRTPCRSRSV
jgi:transposase